MAEREVGDSVYRGDGESRDLVVRARAAQHNDTLATGALYGELADEIEFLRALLAARRFYGRNIPDATSSSKE